MGTETMGVTASTGSTWQLALRISLHGTLRCAPHHRDVLEPLTRRMILDVGCGLRSSDDNFRQVDMDIRGPPVRMQPVGISLSSCPPAVVLALCCHKASRACM